MNKLKFYKIFSLIYQNDMEKLEDALFVLKEKGASQIECVKILMFELKLTLKEADKLVLNSSAWEKEKSSTIQLRNVFFSVIEGFE